MIKFSMAARPGVTRRRGVYLRRRGVAGSVAACAIAASATAGSGHDTGGASAASAFADSSIPEVPGGVRGGSASGTSMLGGAPLERGYSAVLSAARS